MSILTLHTDIFSSVSSAVCFSLKYYLREGHRHFIKFRIGSKLNRSIVHKFILPRSSYCPGGRDERGAAARDNQGEEELLPVVRSSSWKSFHVRPGSGLSLLSVTPWRVGTNVDNKKKRSIVYFSTFGPCLICLFDNKNRRSILSLICVFDNCIWPACLDLANGGKNLRSFFTGSWLTDYLHFHGLLSFILKIMLLGQLSHGD